MVSVTAEVASNVTELQENGSTYSGTLTAPTSRSSEETSVYDVEVTATGDNGASSTETRELIVRGNSLFPLEVLVTKPTGEEIGTVNEETLIDIDLGSSNDFELILSLQEWSRDRFYYEHRLFVPNTEYGGIIKEIEVRTSSNEIIMRGPAWRQLLQKKIVKPPSDDFHLILNGELNEVTRELIGNRFGSLFFVPEIDTGVIISNWQIDRYVTLYDALMKLYESVNYKLQMRYIQPEGLDYGYVELQAVPVVDYSDDLEYSQDGNVNFTVKDYRNGINHLICIGEGQNEERITLDLFIQEDGRIGHEQFYFGLDECEEVYEYTSADLDELLKGGTERLQELRNYKQVDVFVDDIDLDIGDIVSGYEEVTDTRVIKPIVQKILKIQNGKLEIEYKVKGDD